ncbi:MAG TPA: hypothetical protein VFV34_11570 [Blastocatellia bacterium]|nr:hypothetical protein [Blastocatellia bacterium]
MDQVVKKQVESLSGEVGAEIVAEFLSRLDDEYFERFSPEQVRLHMQMASSLWLARPVQLNVAAGSPGQFDLTIVALDFFSELSIICGLISAFGFNIDAGYVYTFSGQSSAARTSQPRRAGSGSLSHRRKIVDVFSVSQRNPDSFNNGREAEFRQELESLIRLLGDRMFAEARDRVNRRLVEYLDQSRPRQGYPDYPLEIQFDNNLSGRWTVLDVRSKDAPAFLYALTNGLAMRGVYIQKARIENVGGEARDRFYVLDRQGNRIESPGEQQRLMKAVGLIKQFTQSLSAAPDPAKALNHFDQFLDAIVDQNLGGRALTLFSDAAGLDMLADLLGSSDFLWEDILRTQLEDLLPVLEEIKEFPLPANRDAISDELSAILAGSATSAEKRAAVNRFKDREMFVIDMKRLLDRRVTLDDFSNSLTDLAEAVLAAACDECNRVLAEQYGQPILESGRPCALAVFGLGKFGGREMGYASDLELLFVYEGQGRTAGPDMITNGEFYDRFVEELIRFIEARQDGIFQIDLRLRPYGSAGALASSLANVKDYYSAEGDVDPFERQALIKLRWVAGDETLGRAVQDHRDQFVYSGAPWDLERALHLRARQIRELVERGKVSVKYSAGGIIDVEYTAQYLQIMEGANNPKLRTPTTLAALDRLRSGSMLSEEDYGILREAYVFMRQLQDALRMVRGYSRDLVLPDAQSDEFKFLARRLGYHDVRWSDSSRHLAEDVRRHRAGVNRVFLAHFKPEEKDAGAFAV